MMISKMLLISKYTYKEILKSRVLYVTCFLAALLMLVTYIATEFTYGVPEKIAIDFGLGMLSISSMGISIFMGANLLSKEIDSRTVYMVISRPVPRYIFITGKLLGLLSVLLVNIAILSVVTVACSHFLGGQISQSIIFTICFNFLECMLLVLVVVFFSLFSNTILASSITVIILLLGHAVKESQTLSLVSNNPMLKKILEFYHLILPGFYKLNLKDLVIYNQNISPTFLINSSLYGIFYSLFLYFLIVYIFENKNLD